MNTDTREEIRKLLCGSSAIRCDAPTGDCSECYRLVDKLIESGVTIQEWIPVNVSPEDNGKLQRFIVCRDRPSATCGNVLIDTEFFTNKFSNPDRITHWMHLPKPPKNKE